MFGRQVDPGLQVDESAPPVDFNQVKTELAAAKDNGGTVAETLRRIGALALAALTVPESKRRQVIAAQLPAHTWPEARLLVVAVDTATGERCHLSSKVSVPAPTARYPSDNYRCHVTTTAVRNTCSPPPAGRSASCAACPAWACPCRPRSPRSPPAAPTSGTACPAHRQARRRTRRPAASSAQPAATTPPFGPRATPSRPPREPQRPDRPEPEPATAPEPARQRRHSLR